MKDRILQEAALEIRRRGLKFSIRDLAGRLGISTKTLYQHFESKEALVSGLVEQTIFLLREQEREVLADDTLSLERKLYDTLVLLPQGLPFEEIGALRELRTAYPRQWKLYDEYTNEGWDNIRKLFRQGIEEGTLRPFDADQFIHVYVGAIYRLMDYEATGRRGASLRQALGQTVEFLLYGIVSDGSRARKEENLS